jgi:hypothetical protein
LRGRIPDLHHPVGGYLPSYLFFGVSDGSDIELNVDGNSRDYSTSGRNATSRHGSFSGRGTGGGRRDD